MRIQILRERPGARFQFIDPFRAFVGGVGWGSHAGELLRCSTEAHLLTISQIRFHLGDIRQVLTNGSNSQ